MILACAGKDPDLFYPDTPQQFSEAREVCRGCPARLRCVRDAMGRRDEYGVHGGLAPAEYLALPPSISDDDLAAVLARADQAGTPAAPGPLGALIGALVHALADVAAGRALPVIPPDPEAALHRKILLRELAAYKAAHRGERPGTGRWAGVAPLGEPRRPGKPRGEAAAADLRQAYNEAARYRRAGRAVPPALGELEREYWRTVKRAQRAEASRTAA